MDPFTAETLRQAGRFFGGAPTSGFGSVNRDSPVWAGLGTPGFDPFRTYEDHMRRFDAEQKRKQAARAEVRKRDEAARTAEIARRNRVKAEARRRSGFSSAPPGAKKFKDRAELAGDDVERLERFEASQAADAQAGREASLAAEIETDKERARQEAAAIEAARKAHGVARRKDLETKANIDAVYAGDASDKASGAGDRSKMWGYLHPVDDPRTHDDGSPRLDRDGNPTTAENPDGKYLGEDEFAGNNPNSEIAEVRRIMAAHPDVDRATAIQVVRNRRRAAVAAARPAPNSTGYF